MLEMKDVQYKVDTYIVENGYYHADNTRKKHLVETGMKKYMIEKISEIDCQRKIPHSRVGEVSLHELAEILGEIIPEKMHNETMAYLTHYVLGVAGFMQGKFVQWDIEDDIAFVSCPLIETNQDGKWGRLVTHEKTPHLKTFDLALERLDQVMELKDKKDKELMKTLHQAS